MTSLKDVLQRVETVAQGGDNPVIVFDLDSTLFDTAGRHLAILRAFAQQAPEIEDLVAQLTEVFQTLAS